MTMTGKTRREQIEEMLTTDPDQDGFLRYCLAMEHLSAGDEAKALGGFRDLIQAKPDYVPGYLQLGQLLARMGEEDEARASYRQGIAEAQQKGDAHAANEMSGFLALLE
jgi:Tfp pilus assembly protein PilF